MLLPRACYADRLEAHRFRLRRRRLSLG